MNDETSLNPFSLSDRRILVTGASSGLGLAIVQSCVWMGVGLIATRRDQARLDGCLITLQLISELPHRAAQADLRVAEERAAVVAAVNSEIHGLVHSAGIFHLCPVRMMTGAHLYEVQSINVDSPMLLTQALPKRDLVVSDGSILPVASIAAHIEVAGVGARSGIKTTLIAMSCCPAVEVVKRNIRVNCLPLLLVETPFLDAATQVVGSMDDRHSSHPMGLGKPEDITNVVIFMLSDASRWVTGTILAMDGGLTISWG